MLTLLAFLLAIGLLVTFHELGHYWVAKLCGVKVLRFSLGFGSPLLRFRPRETEWVVCPIPLGGYVKMLDEREGFVAPSERGRAFNNQHVLKRMAIVAAGPAANLLLAVLLYWGVIAQGVPQLKPLIGTVIGQTPAAAAGFQEGERILSVAGQRVSSWQDVRLALVDAAMSGGAVPVVVQNASGASRERRIDAQRFGDKAAQALQQGDPGLSPARFLPVLGALEENSVAARAGLKTGDKLLAVNGVMLRSWEEWVQIVRNSPGKDLALRIERKGQDMEVKLRPMAVTQDDEVVGRIGVGPMPDRAWNDKLGFTLHYDAMGALLAAATKTGDTAWMSVKFLGNMLIGHASLDNLSGPLTIANVAGQTAREGLTPYLEFLALISVSIGILNLLPIPVLDGGHLMYYVAELVRGKPVSERVQLLGQKIGFILLASLMAFAILNDFSRLFGG
ncbi:RIP metalloprotease RseP [Chromobacterium subtsugae]|uniref:Zinc metalloprotease n=1 Tax=Chromobacterium subtsugae TaxID=251747 RepID=A0ABS7FD51_9NEIS|nr:MULTISPECIES: RIP metalloprotease RseP [Chromobacterium]KUM01888.1 RIP metalloprotease RseP [Chromobacterium subtsugae]KZE88218.1 RIP metalloprotease RseP [Chromobacterium sp. F49]MBW7565601.1 RIP metalloprotease RseP [Chromobacterium subtsugae]MBW8287932.1 RIP metalloprotease RseP [Chromobacterium subtsugae]OBU86919.1 membrane-associated zinc metalloprotease [Chromobacterium subtsugae]